MTPIKWPLRSLKSVIGDVGDVSEGGGTGNMKMGNGKALQSHFMCFVFFLTPVKMSPLHGCDSITALLGAGCLRVNSLVENVVEQRIKNGSSNQERWDRRT